MVKILCAWRAVEVESRPSLRPSDRESRPPHGPSKYPKFGRRGRIDASDLYQSTRNCAVLARVATSAKSREALLSNTDQYQETPSDLVFPDLRIERLGVRVPSSAQDDDEAPPGGRGFAVLGAWTRHRARLSLPESRRAIHRELRGAPNQPSPSQARHQHSASGFVQSVQTTACVGANADAGFFSSR